MVIFKDTYTSLHTPSHILTHKPHTLTHPDTPSHTLTLLRSVRLLTADVAQWKKLKVKRSTGETSSTPGLQQGVDGEGACPGHVYVKPAAGGLMVRGVSWARVR